MYSRTLIAFLHSRRTGYWLVALHTACVLLGTHFFLQGRLTDATYDRLVATVVDPSMSEETRVLRLMAATSAVQWATKELFVPHDPKLPELAVPFSVAATGYMMDPAFHLSRPIGACGSFVLAFAKALERAGVPFRVVQMMCGEQDQDGSCHILLEARVNARWVVLDPLFNQAFRRPDGHLASFAEVSADWNYYQKQIPAWRTQLTPSHEQYYDTALYNYRGVRYTNWDKVPVILPAIRSGLSLWLGDDAVEHLSIRTYAIDINRVYGLLTLGVYACLWILTGLRLGRRLPLEQRATVPRSGQQHDPTPAA